MRLTYCWLPPVAPPSGTFPPPLFPAGWFFVAPFDYSLKIKIPHWNCGKKINNVPAKRIALIAFWIPCYSIAMFHQHLSLLGVYSKDKCTGRTIFPFLLNVFLPLSFRHSCCQSHLLLYLVALSICKKIKLCMIDQQTKRNWRHWNCFMCKKKHKYLLGVQAYLQFLLRRLVPKINLTNENGIRMHSKWKEKLNRGR